VNTVGSGSSGAVIANRLSEDPEVSVLLIEAGGSELDDDNFRIPLHASIPQKTKADWTYYTVPQHNSHLGMNNQVNSISFDIVYCIASNIEFYFTLFEFSYDTMKKRAHSRKSSKLQQKNSRKRKIDTTNTQNMTTHSPGLAQALH